jgi:hypothetical protein
MNCPRQIAKRIIADSSFSRSQGQKAKYSLRADVFRFAPDSGHVATAAAFPFRADIVAKVFFGGGTQILRPVDAAIE